MSELSSREVLKFYIASGVDETYGESPTSSFPDLIGEFRQTKRLYDSLDPPVKPEGDERGASQGDGVMAFRNDGVRGNAETEAERIAAACVSVAELQTAIRAFDLCPLAKFATHPIVGVGVERPKLLIITEMPEAVEDASGQALSGAQGELLLRITPNLGRSFERDAFVFPAIFWRSAGGVAPDKAMVSMLRPFVKRFVELLAPEMILVLGSVPLMMLWECDEAMASAHGRWLKYGGVLAMPTFSLSSMLANPDMKKAAWNDMKLLLAPPEKSNLS